MSIRLGVVGYGSRGRFMASQMYQRHEEFVLTAVAERDMDGVPAKLKEEGLDLDKVQIFPDLDSMLEADVCDCVIVATNCSTHTELAIKVLEKGLPLYLEKPVCTTMEDYYRLKEAGEKYPDVPVVVSFPLRVSQICLDAKKIIESGELGRVEQVQGYNNVPYGGVYYHNWYRNYDVAGGLFLQKATHDLDYIQYVLGGDAPR
jgi:predicted dehydrogenase